MIEGRDMLEWLRGRRSIRSFTGQPIDRAVLARVVEAATMAPSATNRQPWRFSVVTSSAIRRRIAGAVRIRTDEMKRLIGKSPHASEIADYGDFFFEPLEEAAAIVVPQYREYPDHIAHMIAAGGAEGETFHTPSSMHVELCATSAAIMLLLLQARAEGLGACWMAGPRVARSDIEAILGIAPPYEMLGAVALGHPDEDPPATRRRSLERVVAWFEDREESK